jgi:hypothetical protein
MTNIQNIRLTKSVSSVPNLSFWGAYLQIGCIAEIHNLAKVWVAYTEYTVSAINRFAIEYEGKLPI